MTTPEVALLRRRMAEMVGAVVVVHAVGVACLLAFDIRARSPEVQRWFLWGWLGLGAVVVGVGLRRMRVARRALMHRLAGPR